MITPPPPRCKLACRRLLDAGSRRAPPSVILSEPDWCRDCGRPLTEDAKNRANLATVEGFIAIAQRVTRQSSVWPTGEWNSL